MTQDIKWTPYDAIACVEGFDSNDWSEEDQLSAWKYIKDTGLWRNLQGWYGRTVHHLTEEGLI
jgi:hypothetical protein